jgi:DNA-binding SARP family transcriptional activator/TolB-like protein
MLTIRLLGGASLEGPEGPLTGRVAQRKPLALLAILAADRARSVSRDRLMLLLAPELDTERARHLLRDTTYALRSALGQDTVVGAGEELRLDRSQVRCDLWEFDAALDAGDLAGAVALYQGPFLDGFHLKDSPEFDTWASAERERLAARQREALEALAGAATAAGDHAGAAKWWTQRLTSDPLHRVATLRLMEALAASGDTAAALRRAATHAALLNAELGSPPDPQVEALAARLRTAPPPVAGGNPPGQPHFPPPGGPPVPPTAAPAALPWGWAALIGVLLLVPAVLLLRQSPERGSVEVDPRRVAVAPFRNATGDAAFDPLSGMVADWVTQGLAATGLVEVVPASTAIGIVRRSADSGSFGGDTAPVTVMAEGTGAGTIVYGAIYREGEELLFQARVADARAGTILVALDPVRGATQSPLTAVEQLRRAIVAALAPHLDARLAGVAGQTSRPPSYEAYRDYAEGLERFVARDMVGAEERFARAAAADSSYVSAQLWAALARWNRGDHPGGDSIAAAIERRGPRLAPVDDAILRSLRAWGRGDWAGAYEAAALGVRAAPGSGMAAAQLATEARRLNRLTEARQVLEGLDPDRGDLMGWVFYWNELADVHHLRGDHRAERRAVAEALRRHPDDAIARLIELRALAAAGREAEVHRRLDDALSSPVAPFFGALAREAALELMVHDRTPAGRQVLERALAWYQDRLASPSAAPQGVTRGMVRPLMMLGQHAEAIAVLDGLAAPTSMPARVDHHGQRALLAELSATSSEADDRLGHLDRLAIPLANGRVEWWRAAVLGARGDCAGALGQLRLALSLGVEFGMELHHAWELAPLRRCPGWRALVRARG